MRIFIYKRKNLLETSGGVEKVLTSVSNELAQKGHQVFLACHDKNKKKKLFFELSKDVEFFQFKNHFGFFRMQVFKMIKKTSLIKFLPYFDNNKFTGKQIYDYCKQIKPDVMIASSIADFIELNSIKENKIPKIVMLHGNPKSFFKKSRKDLYIKELNMANCIQVLMPSFIDALPQTIKTKKIAIGNFIPSLPQSKKTNNTIIYMAKFEAGKGQDYIINAFAKIASQNKNWQIHLWGGCNDKNYLKLCKNLIKKHSLEKQVIIKGVTKNTINELSKAKVCAFGSANEGFGLALAEAMASGLAVIGRKDCPAVNELIIDGKNGLLANNINDFAIKLNLLLNDKKLRETLGNQAIKIGSKYSVEKIISQWEELLITTIKAANKKGR